MSAVLGVLLVLLALSHLSRAQLPPIGGTFTPIIGVPECECVWWFLSLSGRSLSFLLPGADLFFEGSVPTFRGRGVTGVAECGKFGDKCSNDEACVVFKMDQYTGFNCEESWLYSLPFAQLGLEGLPY